MDQYIGKMLDNRYELLEVVGTGGMAVVYRAKCHRLNRFVAVKILKPEAAKDPELRRRFRDESQAVAMLSHPNIVAVYDVSKTENLEYIVMELIDGITLKQYIRQKGDVLPWKEALHFITQVMRGLRHAHSRGIVHRDIKPQNIMVLRDGSCKVADFGIACLGNAQPDTQEALGSIHYIAPEQAKGARVDARSDIYSAGVVLYEMLTGHVPYEGDTPVAVALQRMQTQPELPGTANPKIPLGLEQITMKAMAIKPGARYDSARAMLVDLDTLQKNPKFVFPYAIGKEALTKIPKVSDEDETQLTPVLTDADLGLPPRKRPSRRGARAAYTEAEAAATTEQRQKKKKSDKAPIIIAAIILLLAFIMALSFAISNLFGGSSVEETEIPSLVGMLYDAAVTRYGDEFEVVIGTYVQDDTKTAGVILSQTPEAGATTTQTKAVITVSVCVHTDSITMPDVSGYSEADALAVLQNAGISSSNIIKGTAVYSDTVEAGYVAYTSPASGSVVTSGTSVTYYLSMGADPNAVVEEEEAAELVTVPDFTGSSRTQVLTQLKSLGLEGTFTEVEDDSDAGTVLSQSVAAGSEVESGTNIEFTVSTGPVEEEAEEETPTTEDTTTEDAAEEEEEPEAEAEEESSTDTGTTESSVVSSDHTYTVTLPSYDEEVTIVIKVGDATAYSRSGVDTSSGSITALISGTGTQTVSVYINGELYSTESVTFN